MKKLSKTISLMLAFVMVLSLPNLLLVNVQALEIGSEESLGAVNACNGHILGTFSGVPACVNESGDLHICENNFPDENFRNCIDQQCGRDGYSQLFRYKQERLPRLPLRLQERPSNNLPAYILQRPPLLYICL